MQRCRLCVGDDPISVSESPSLSCNRSHLVVCSPNHRAAHAQADVINRGYSGYNTRWSKYLLQKVFPASQKPGPALVTVFYGANDAALPDRIRYVMHMAPNKLALDCCRQLAALP